MFNGNEIMETINMIAQENLDIRTITMGISLRDCASDSYKTSCTKIYDKISRYAQNLVKTGEDIERDFGIPIINKRISITPMAMVAESSDADNYAVFARAMDDAAKNVGVNFIGGFSALIHKGYTKGDRILVQSIPEALSTTERVCSSVNVATTKAGINMDAVRDMGIIIKECAERTKDRGAVA